MPIVDAQRQQPSVTVSGSFAVELYWVTSSLQRPDFWVDHPVLREVHADRPDLEQRLGEFWGRDDEKLSCNGFMEVLLAAYFGGVLYSLDDDVLANLEDICAALPPEARALPLVTEEESDRAAIITRLGRLKRSEKCRADLAALMRDTWEAVHLQWEVLGRSTVDAGVRRRQEALGRGANWLELVRTNCDFADLLTVAVAGLPPGGTIAVVPAYFAHRGLLMDAPGLVLFSVATDVTGAEARAQTEDLAKGLKTLSDPTRLALLGLLRSRPRTVSELASLLDVSQPTVSTHVKVLREAGLLVESRDGSRRPLFVRPEAVTELIRGVEKTLGLPLPSP